MNVTMNIPQEYKNIHMIQSYMAIDFNRSSPHDPLTPKSMPIHKERFETIEEDGIRPGTNADRIMNFLLENEDYAFGMTEIAEGTEIPKGSVGPTLQRMKEDGLVEHRANYWRVSDSYLASKAGITMVNEVAAEYDDGKEFDIESWDEVAEESIVE